MSRTVPLLLLAVCLAAADPAPGTYLSQDGIHLTLDDRRAVLQTAEGQAVAAFRLVREGGEVRLYQFGTAVGSRLVADPGGVVLERQGERHAFASCPTPPEPTGWQPYELPPTEADAGKRKVVAKELQRRFQLEQRLRHEAIKLSGGQMDQATMQKPEVARKWQEVNAADEDNKRWLLATLRSHGWIGRKSHGPQAHQAILLIALHNVNHLRLGATVLAQMRAEQQRKELDEMAVANIADRFALVTGEPLSYGIQATVGMDGKPIIPILADAAQVDANRKRIGQPPLATAAAMMQATVMRIGDDGRLVAGGAAEVTGLDAIDMRKAMTDPAWGLAEAGKADAALGQALAAAAQGDPKPLTAWTKAAPQPHRDLLNRILQNVGRVVPGQDAEAAVVAQRVLLDGFLAGLPARDDGRILLANSLAYGLSARAAAPNAEELARAVALAKDLEAALKRPEVVKGPHGHGITDTIACVRFRQGQLAEAAALWKKAIALADKTDADLYRRRLAVAEAGDASAALPR